VKLNRELLQRLTMKFLKLVPEKTLPHPECATDIIFTEEARDANAFQYSIPCTDDRPVIVRDDYAFEPPNT
jgi:hypothetical protein